MHTHAYFIAVSTGSGGFNILASSAADLERRLTGENSSSNTCSSKRSRLMPISGRDLNNERESECVQDY